MLERKFPRAGWWPRHGAGSARPLVARNAVTNDERPRCPAWSGPSPTVRESPITHLDECGLRVTCCPMARVAVLGTGIMGAPMARRLVDAGHEVAAWNRTREKA